MIGKLSYPSIVEDRYCILPPCFSSIYDQIKCSISKLGNPNQMAHIPTLSVFQPY